MRQIRWTTLQLLVPSQQVELIALVLGADLHLGGCSGLSPVSYLNRVHLVDSSQGGGKTAPCSRVWIH